MPAFVKNGFESRFRSIRTMIGYVNAEVNAFNNNLRKFAMQCLEERKKRASSLSFISQMLEIPLERSDTAPNISPIPLERIVRTPVKKPDSKPLPNEYAIKDFDYENLPIVEIVNDIILDSIKKGASDIHFDPHEDVLKVDHYELKSVELGN